MRSIRRLIWKWIEDTGREKKSGGRSEVALGGPTVQEKSKNDGEMFRGGRGSTKVQKN